MKAKSRILCYFLRQHMSRMGRSSAAQCFARYVTGSVRRPWAGTGLSQVIEDVRGGKAALALR